MRYCTAIDPGSVAQNALNLSDGPIIDEIPQGDPVPGALIHNDNDVLPPEEYQEAQLPRVQDLRHAEEFVRAVRNATLATEPLAEDVLERLRNPPTYPLDLSDADLRMSIDLYLAVRNASEETYNATRTAIMRRHPEDHILSYHAVRSKVTELTGVTSVTHDMCIDSCVAFTGPFAKEEACPICKKPRYDPIQLARSGGSKKVPQRQFHTMPLGPQLQALARSPEGAKDISYLSRRIDEVITEINQNEGKLQLFNDWLCGEAVTDTYDKKHLGPHDFALMMSLDGAQLYRSKQSDCWIYIWVVMNHSPDVRYKRKHILVGAVIPGPNKPKNVDSFLFPGIRHVSALQKEGLRIWNAHTKTVHVSYPFLAFATADTPGAIYLNGLAGTLRGSPSMLYT